VTCAWAEGKDAIRCEELAVCRMLDKHSRQWANLCHGHNLAFLRALDDPDSRRVLGAWARAKGGAKAAAEAM
jgi:hypothetical protein